MHRSGEERRSFGAFFQWLTSPYRSARFDPGRRVGESAVVIVSRGRTSADPRICAVALRNTATGEEPDHRQPSSTLSGRRR